MAAIKDSTLKITVDVERAEAKAKSLAAVLTQTGFVGKQAGHNVKEGTDLMSQGLQNAGDKAAAAQLRFQTMTQGMLNLSTTAVQTYTSMSNLDRVQVNAKQSTISLHRAQDLLERKQFALNKEMARAVPNMQKVGLIQGEIATATEDLSVKLEKNKIAVQDVTEVQLLFAANIANVVVSSLQVVTRMIGDQRTALIYNTIATKFDTIARWNNSNAIGGNIIQRRLDTLTLYTNTGALAATTLATKLQTLALNGLKVALGPIGLIFIGISAAMMAYETNALGLKDTINGLLGIHDEFNDKADETKDSVDQLDHSIGNLSDGFKIIPGSMVDAVTALERYTDVVKKAREENLRLIDTNKEVMKTTSGFNSGGAPTHNIGGGIFDFFANFGKVQWAEASSTDTSEVPFIRGESSQFTSVLQSSFKSARGKGRFASSGSFSKTGLQQYQIEALGALTTLGVNEKEFIFLMSQPWFKKAWDFGPEYMLKQYIENRTFRLTMKQVLATYKDIKFTSGLPDIQSNDSYLIQELQRKAAIVDKDDEAYFKMREPTYGMNKEQLRRYYLSTGNFAKIKDTVLNGIPLSDRAKFSYAATNLRRDLKSIKEKEIKQIIGFKEGDLLDRDTALQLIGLRNLGKSLRLKNSNLPIDTTGFGEMRRLVALSTSFDIGGVADSLSKDDAIRIGFIERVLNQNYANRQGGKTDSMIQFLNQQSVIAQKGGLLKQGIFGSGFFKSQGASGAFQSSGRLKIDPIFETERRQRDRLANSELMGLGSIFGFKGTLSKSGSKAFGNISREVSYVSGIIGAANMFGFGSDPESVEEANEIKQEMFDRFNAGGKGAKYAAIGAIGKMANLAEKYGNKVENILGQIGINFETTQPVYTGTWSSRLVKKRGSMKTYENIQDVISSQEQYRRDLQASQGIKLPFGTELLGIVNSFINNGLFTNFNNTGIISKSIIGLNLTEQSVFDIRFQHTRGDRELLNRLRYVELLQMGSSGTSPI